MVVFRGIFALVNNDFRGQIFLIGDAIGDVLKNGGRLTVDAQIMKVNFRGFQVLMPQDFLSLVGVVKARGKKVPQAKIGRASCRERMYREV